MAVFSTISEWDQSGAHEHFGPITATNPDRSRRSLSHVVSLFSLFIPSHIIYKNKLRDSKVRLSEPGRRNDEKTDEEERALC